MPMRNRGYCAIGIWQPKREVNVGTLWRSASILGAAYIFSVGRRYNQQSSDTIASWKHIPMFHFADKEDMLAHLPYGCPLVGIEIDERARSLQSFSHPERAVYLLGAEDYGLPNTVRDECHFLVQLPGDLCLNVAAAGSIALYDRLLKRPSISDGYLSFEKEGIGDARARPSSGVREGY